VYYEGKYYFPAVKGYYPGKSFGENVPGEANYRALKERWQSEKSKNWLSMPIYPYGQYEDINVEGNKMYEPPSAKRINR
jgi:microcin C transport system permease protein